MRPAPTTVRPSPRRYRGATAKSRPRGVGAFVPFGTPTAHDCSPPRLPSGTRCYLPRSRSRSVRRSHLTGATVRSDPTRVAAPLARFAAGLADLPNSRVTASEAQQRRRTTAGCAG
jgi:hypothetical protein